MQRLDQLGLALARASDSHGSRAAIVDDNGTVTYEELYLRAGGFAHAVDQETSPEATIVICLAPGLDVYSAILGCVLAGRTFCTLSPTDPEVRRQIVLEILGPDLLIADSKRVVSPIRTVLTSDVGNERFAPRRPTSELLYVLFTSGSTGLPKGVRIAERAVLKFLEWALRFYQPSPSDRWSQFNVPTFDLSLVDLFVALTSGASLVPFHSPVDRLRPSKKVSRLAVTVWHAVPSTIQLLLEGGRTKHEALASIRLFSFCGEPLMTHTAAQLRAAAPTARVVNTYGPTETTFFFTAHEVDGDDLQLTEATVPLGEPIEGWELELAQVTGDTEAELFEVVVHGQYIGRGYVGGAQGGYQGDPGKPTSFRTGDLVRVRERKIYFDSRMDRQRKVRGVRLELGEVERAAFDSGLGNTCAEVRDGQLVLFVSREESSSEDPEEIRDLISRRLPGSMVPSLVVFVDMFPRTKSSKIDVKKLLEIDRGTS